MTDIPEDRWKQLETRLNEAHTWPCTYHFKCIVPQASEAAFHALFPGSNAQVRPSAKGNYLSLTLDIPATCAEDVLEVYRKASTLPGAILL